MRRVLCCAAVGDDAPPTPTCEARLTTRAQAAQAASQVAAPPPAPAQPLPPIVPAAADGGADAPYDTLLELSLLGAHPHPEALAAPFHFRGVDFSRAPSQGRLRCKSDGGAADIFDWCASRALAGCALRPARSRGMPRHRRLNVVSTSQGWRVAARAGRGYHADGRRRHQDRVARDGGRSEHRIFRAGVIAVRRRAGCASLRHLPGAARAVAAHAPPGAAGRGRSGRSGHRRVVVPRCRRAHTSALFLSRLHVRAPGRAAGTTGRAAAGKTAVPAAGACPVMDIASCVPR